MDRRRMTMLGLGFGILILLVVVLFATSTVRQADRITLPEDGENSPSGDDGESGDTSSLELVGITTETVQRVVATMSRLEAYSRTVTVETFWEGGSQSAELQTYVSGSLTRVDSRQADGSIRHLLTDGETSCIWYDDAREWISLPAGDFTSDTEQRIPTYEDILELPVSEIASASYGDYQGLYCIAVETLPDGEGYYTQYWISAEAGLLAGSETYQWEELVYRMTALTVDASTPSEDLFLLPDGSSLA